MKVEQIYTKCLSEASYFIVSGKEAVVIDPIRESDPYLEMAKEAGVAIKYIFETHFHADFVSGHIELAKRTGATIVFGPTAQTGYKAHIGQDGEIFKVGDVSFQLLHTPGHTPESSSYLLFDEKGKEHAVFTGDTLFVGDVGRPDLAVKSTLTQDDLAGMLYESLNNKIKTLADDVIVYPAHGAGSSCGKNIGKETFSTIGVQKKTNYALQPMSKAEFINVVTEGLLAPPSYFFEDARINKVGYDDLDRVLNKNTRKLSVEEAELAIKNGALVLDARHQDLFEKGFIPGAVNIGLGGQFAIWAGTLLPIAQPLIILAESNEKVQETVLRLARVGYENVVGCLDGGFDAWKAKGKPVDTVQSVDAKQATAMIQSGKHVTLDVRNPGEVQSAHIKGAVGIRLQELEESLPNLDKSASYVVHCAGGYRSMMAVSIMKRHGFTNLTNVLGGYGELQKQPLEHVAGMCATEARNAIMAAKSMA